MNLGVRTVHDDVTMLYEHFHVSSRAELLGYFIRRRPVHRSPAEVGIQNAIDNDLTRSE